MHNHTNKYSYKNDSIQKSLYKTSFQSLSSPPPVPPTQHPSKQPPSSTKITTPTTREEALQQANAVIQSTSYQQRQFENFNLLGVVTTPTSFVSLNQSQHGTTSYSSSSNNNNNNALDESIIETLGLQSYVDPNHNLFSNLSSMSSNLTKEIESMNDTLYSYSKNYLGTYSSLSHTYNSLVNSGVGIVGGTSNVKDNGGNGGVVVGKRNGTIDGRSGNSIITSATSTTTTSTSSTSSSSSISTPSSLDYENELLSSILQDGGEYKHIRNVEELSSDLVELDLSSVEKYLRRCGILAQKLEKELLLSQQQQEEENAAANVVDVEDNDANGSNCEGGKDSISKIPELFFSPNFDLTDPKTFESLLVLNDDDDDNDMDYMDDMDDYPINNNNNNNNTSNNNTKNDPIIRIPKPEQLTQYLDTIELGLLNQVRSKSDSFFRETNRFSYLKSLVADLVLDVQTLRDQLDDIQDKSVTEVELIPVMDRRRKDIHVLGEVLDEIMDVVDVKGSVAGLIANGDFLGAVEAIHMARSLLNGNENDSTCNGDYDDTTNGHVEKSDDVTASISSSNGGRVDVNVGRDDIGKKKKRYALGKVVALNKVNDQLAQYENLVVSIFIHHLPQTLLRHEIIVLPLISYCYQTGKKQSSKTGNGFIQ